MDTTPWQNLEEGDVIRLGRTHRVVTATFFDQGDSMMYLMDRTGHRSYVDAWDLGAVPVVAKMDVDEFLGGVV